MGLLKFLRCAGIKPVAERHDGKTLAQLKTESEEAPLVFVISVIYGMSEGRVVAEGAVRNGALVLDRTVRIVRDGQTVGKGYVAGISAVTSRGTRKIVSIARRGEHVCVILTKVSGTVQVEDILQY